MKIEMGESLFYSWLRHVKDCQVVQSNWKPSPSWQLQHGDELQQFMAHAGEHYQSKYGYNIYKNNSFSQLLQQAEVDALGISISEDCTEIYAVDVAFHKDGLLYGGGRQDTVMVILKKLIRTALCMKGYFGVDEGEIIFASPKIHNAVLNDLEPCIEELSELLAVNALFFVPRIIANDDFNEHILKPILIASDGVSDTSELFMRGYQLVKMFGDDRPTSRKRTSKSANSVTDLDADSATTDTLSEFKVGKIAQTLLRKALENGTANDEEIQRMQTKPYSKNTFGIDFPLLVAENSEYDSVRYYSKPLNISGKRFYLCSQWFEVSANNDRPFLLAWLAKHGVI